MNFLSCKWGNRLLSFPRRRYNIYMGTNNRKEWYQMAKALLLRKSEQDLALIEKYEQQFADHCGVKHCISFGAGRMALYAILESLQIGAGDEVIIPAFTCVVVPNAIIYRGAVPVYVDIKLHDFNIDAEIVERAITVRTRALYAQHTFGVACDISALRDIGRKHGLPVIEDSAHALGTMGQCGVAGSMTEVAFFSTDHSKVINTHLGGMVATNNNVLADSLRKIQKKSPFLSKKDTNSLIFSFLVEYICFLPVCLWLGRSFYRLFAKLGLLFFFQNELIVTKPNNYPCRLTSRQAQLGLSQLAQLDENLAHRRYIASWLERKLNWYKRDPMQMMEATWLRYSFLVKNRDEFILRFSKNFDLDIWFTTVLAGRSDNFQDIGYVLGSCPLAEFAAQHIVNFPTHKRIPLDLIQKEIERNWDWLKDEMQSEYSVQT